MEERFWRFRIIFVEMGIGYTHRFSICYKTINNGGCTIIFMFARAVGTIIFSIHLESILRLSLFEEDKKFLLCDQLVF